MKLYRIFVFMLVIAGLSFAEKNTFSVDEYLCLGPIEISYPVFSNDDADAKELVKFNHFETSKWRPSEGTRFTDNSPLEWRKIKSSLETDFSKDKINLYYVAFYIKNDKWTKAEVNVTANSAFSLLCEGEEVTHNYEMNGATLEKKKEVKLERGNHLFLMKIITDVQPEFKVTLDSENDLAASVDRTDITSVDEMLDNPKIKEISLSPSGEYAMIKTSERNLAKSDDVSSIKIYRMSDKMLMENLDGPGKVSGFQWLPAGDLYSWISTVKGKSTIYISGVKEKEEKILLKEVENLTGYKWSPDGTFIIYTLNETKKQPDKNFLKYEEPQDRYPWANSRSYLYYLEPETGLNYRLTDGDLTTTLADINPDGSEILFTRFVTNFDERPYGKTEYYLLNLTDLKEKKILELNWGGGAKYSPYGESLLIAGGPSTFGKSGKVIDQKIIPNDYDAQAYLYELKSGQVKSITRDFNPSVLDFQWVKDENTIYFQALDKSYKKIYRYTLKSGKFEEMRSGIEVVEDMSISKDGKSALYYGSSSNITEKVYSMDLETGEHTIFFDPEEGLLDYIQYGKVVNWNFNYLGREEITGRIYLPPEFDASKKYPCIVYYYAGTSPVTREFEGRYPKNIWAANGYVVYVLQPSGAAGFGQEFSAKHVNDWGELTVKQIIEGTKELLKNHEFIDPERVGCIGASYGGFETLSLITKTDMFAAAVSHAGISSLSSYWGEGFWGFLYSAVATAESFPWNRKDIYVDKSPLFSADKINTPLLLLHGNSDTNVPRGESIQMYTALRLLGKDVELIEVAGQDHHIMQYDKRKKWTKTIIAWFDKYLKGEDGWWKDLYSEE